MSQTYDYDLFVIGGGSGGVRCARIAAGHGARVGIAEDTYWGGTCVNVGCVPKKIMVQASEYGRLAADSRGFGWDGPAPQHDWAALIGHKDAEIRRLNGIYQRMLGESGVDAARRARALHRAAHARGGRRDGDGGADRDRDRRQAGDRAADRGMEHGITSDDVVPSADAAAAGPAGGRRLYRDGVRRHLRRARGARSTWCSASICRCAGSTMDLRECLAEGMDGAWHPAASEPDGAQHRAGRGRAPGHADERACGRGGPGVLRRRPRAAHARGSGWSAAGVAMDAKGAVIVDDENATSQAHIFAVGDVSNKLNLTPVAIAEGHHLADRLFGRGRPRSWSFDPVPTAVFSAPPLATVRADRGAGGRARPGRHLRRQVHADAARHVEAAGPDADEAGRRPGEPARAGRPHAGRRRRRR